MSDYLLLSDSTVDLPFAFMEKAGVPFIGLTYNLSDVSKQDDLGKNTNYHEFYENMKTANALPTTAQINISEYTDFFEKYLEQDKDIVYIGFSSGLSGSYNSAVIASNELKEKYPDRKIAVIDSKCASLGEGLLLNEAIKFRDEGADFDSLVNHIESIKLKLNHWFTVDDLHHLHRGGRVSKTAAILGSFLNIKPVLNVNNEGKLAPVEKQKGRIKAITALIDKVEKYIVNPEKQTIFISHGDCYDDAVFLKNEISKRIKVKDFLINVIGPVIGSHSGPGTLAVFFFGNNREI